jgi:nitroreductase
MGQKEEHHDDHVEHDGHEHDHAGHHGHHLPETVFEAIQTRRSIRKYENRQVPRDLVTKVIDAGRFAPNAGNLQNWKFILVEKPHLRNEIADASSQQWWIASAPHIIVLIGEPDKGKRFYGERGERLYTVQNTAAAATSMILAAHSIGLGTCWVGAFDEQRIAKLLYVPEENRVQAIITLGYPDEHPPEPSKYPIEVTCYFNGWRGRLEDVEAYMGFHSVKIQEGLHNMKNKIDSGLKKITEKGKEMVDKLYKEKEERK